MDRNSVALSPLVSVVVPVYNQEKYVGRCIRSLLHQTLDSADYEIIFIDDGSTDLTSYVLNQFLIPHDEHVRLFTNKSNMGLPYSVNIGIKESRGKFIVRVDSDDYVNKNLLSSLLCYLQLVRAAHAVACDYFFVDDDERQNSIISCEDEPIACGIMFRKECLFEIGLYNEKYIYNEDKDLRIRFEKKYKIHRLPMPLYRYRMHDSNMTKNIELAKEYNLKLNEEHGCE